MTRSRILCLGFLFVLAAVPIACISTVQHQSTPQAGAAQPVASNATATPSAAVPSVAANEVTCKMFLLGDLAEDATYAKWIVDTIPTMIQPGTWDQKKGTAENRSISYFAPGRVLVVYHTATVQAKVDEFLKGLKHASAQVTKPTPNAPAVQQAQFVPGGNPPPPPPGYPVAAPVQQPKHLFHFIIRYEGEGILDANVVNFAKAMQAAGGGDLGLFKVNQYASDPMVRMDQAPRASPPETVSPVLQTATPWSTPPAPAVIQSVPQTIPSAPNGSIQNTPPAPTQPLFAPAASQPTPQAAPSAPPGPPQKMPPVDSAPAPK